jgi:hypothetical protein
MGALGSTRGGEEARGWGRPDDAGGELPARRGAAAPVEWNRERIRSGRGEPKLALGFRGGILFHPTGRATERERASWSWAAWPLPFKSTFSSRS